MNIAEIVLGQEEWPLSDDDDSHQIVKTRQEATLIKGFINQAIQCAISGNASNPKNPKITFEEMREQLHAMCHEEVSEDALDMAAWARAVKELLKMHKPSARYITWLLSDVAAELVEECIRPMFVEHFATFSNLDLDYLVGCNCVDANIVLLVWAERTRNHQPAENGPFSLDFVKRFLADEDPHLLDYSYRKFYSAILHIYGLQILFDVCASHNVHRPDTLRALAYKLPCEEARRLLTVPDLFFIDIDELRQLYAYKPSHPWTSIKTVEQYVVRRNRVSLIDLDFIRLHRSQVMHQVHLQVPIRPLADIVRGYVFQCGPFLRFK